MFNLQFDKFLDVYKVKLKVANKLDVSVISKVNSIECLCNNSLLFILVYIFFIAFLYYSLPILNKPFILVELEF